MDEKKFWEIMNQNNTAIEKMMACNQYTEKFGITLSKDDAKILSLAHKATLKEQERVEFGEGIMPKLIYTFCDSPYIYQDNYVEIMEGLLDIFYLYKNESLDELSDDELIDFMKEHFDGDCQGSLEFLEETILEDFARNIRKNTMGFMGRGEEYEGI